MNRNILSLTESLGQTHDWDQQVAALLEAIREPYGYDTFVIGVVPTFDGNIQSAPVLLHNMNKRWITEHDRNGYGFNASVYHCLERDDPLLWSVMHQNAMDSGHRHEIHINERRMEYYVGGVTLPQYTQWTPYRFGISLTSKDLRGYEAHDQMFALYEMEIRTIARLFFSFANWTEKLIEFYKLSDEAVAIMSDLLRGNSRKDVAEFRDISEHTVTYHIRTVIKKFGVQTAEQALVRFAMLGLTKFVRQHH